MTMGRPKKDLRRSQRVGWFDSRRIANRGVECRLGDRERGCGGNFVKVPNWCAARASRFMKWLALLALGFAFSGCALVYEGRYDYDAGWRRATVLSVGLARQIERSAAFDCRGSFGVTDETSFAFVRYNHMPYTLQRAIVPVPQDWQLSVGDGVYINIRDCNEPMVHVTDPT